jgi:hypothetical protein
MKLFRTRLPADRATWLAGLALWGQKAGQMPVGVDE